MKRAAFTIAAACCIDALIGDPHWIPHPVRAIGAAVAVGERRLNGSTGKGSRAAGALLSLILIGAAAGVGRVAQRWRVASVALAATTLAARDLLTEAEAIARALERGDLALARTRVARIVGRDTAHLDAVGVARAAIESLGESACDGIVAPLFWFALCGLPGALGFKAASTLDSMIGHREPRYRRFGAFAARTDDALNYVPARMTALFIALAAGAPRRIARIALRDAPRHASPNAGWPEAALAAALGIRLGGANSYDGMLLSGPLFNADGKSPGVDDIRRAMRLVRRATLMAEVCAVAACA